MAIQTKKPAVPAKRAAQPQKFFTYAPSDPRSHLKIKPGQQVAFQKAVNGGDGGYYAVPKAAAKAKVITDVKKGGTAQNYGTSIETPAQIEARVTRMAQAAYDRQKGDLDLEVARMKREAEGRRLGMIAAYQAAGQQNAAMSGKVQDGWNIAANNLQGLAGATTGGIGDALQAATAGQDQALAHIGAGGTGFDATSQQGVEDYRGGTVPAEAFTRYGGIANEYLQRMGDNLKREGLATATATEREALAKVAQDRLTQVRTLGENRTKYEEDLRKQLLDARGDQLDAQAASAKLIADIQMKKATLDQQYLIAKMNATTKKELQQVDMIYKAQALGLKQQEVTALNAQRNAAAGLSVAKTNDLINNPGGTGKPASAASTSAAVARANKAADTALAQSLSTIWANTPGANMPSTFQPNKPFKERQAAYAASPEFAAAIAKRDRQRTASFGTINAHVFRALKNHLKAFKYTDAKLRSMAYEILISKGIKPPANWKTPAGFAPQAGAAAGVPSNIFGTPSWMTTT